MVPHPKTPILNWFYHLLWFSIVTVSEFNCLAKSYSVSFCTERRLLWLARPVIFCVWPTSFAPHS